MRHRTSFTRLWLLVFFATLSASLPAQGQGTLNEFGRSLAAELGFSKGDIKSVEKGEVATRKLRKEGEKELAIVLMALLPASAGHVIERSKEFEPLTADRTIHSWGKLEAPITAESFALLELPDEELEKLAGDDPDEEFNFSADELGRLDRSVDVYRRKIGSFPGSWFASVAPASLVASGRSEAQGTASRLN